MDEEKPKLERSTAEEIVKKTVEDLVKLGEKHDIYFKEKAVQRIRDIVWMEIETYYDIY